MCLLSYEPLPDIEEEEYDDDDEEEEKEENQLKKCLKERCFCLKSFTKMNLK
jgi:hypothetical protein